MDDCSLREAGGAGSLEEVAPLSTEGFCDPGEVRGERAAARGGGGMWPSRIPEDGAEQPEG